MSNLTDLVNQLEADDNFCKGTAWQTLGNVLGALADVSGAIGFVQLAVTFVEALISQDNAIQDLLTAIENDLKALSAQIAIDDKLNRASLIDQVMSSATGVFQNLPYVMTKQVPVPEDIFLSQLTPCLDALEYFAQGTGVTSLGPTFAPPWLTNWSEWQGAYYVDDWSGTIAPTPDPDGTVFNPAYAFPQFLRAIYMTLTTISALAPSAGPTYAATWTSCVQALSLIHDTMKDGITPSRLPAVLTGESNSAWSDDLGNVDSSNGCNLTMNWATYSTDKFNAGTVWPYGAIDLYSATNIVESCQDRYFGYQPDCSGGTPPPFPPVGWMSTTDMNQIVSLIGLRVSQRMKELYATIGLPQAQQAITQLNALAGTPSSAAPLYTDWSLEEIFNDLGLPWPSTADPLAAIDTFLQSTSPFLPTPGFGVAPDLNPEDYGDPCDMLVPAFPVPAGLSFVIADLPDGTYIQGSPSGNQYVFAGGAPIYITPEEWSAWPGGTPDAVQIPDARVTSTWWVAVDGTWLTGAQTGNLYLVSGGAPYLQAADPSQASIVVDQAAIDNAGQPGVWSHLNAPCFISTAAFGSGSPLAPEIRLQHKVQDEVLLQTEWGREWWVDWNRYYSRISPPIAAEMNKDSRLRNRVRWGIVQPWVLYIKMVLTHPDWGAVHFDRLEPDIRDFLLELRRDMDAWLSEIELPRTLANRSASEAVPELDVILTYGTGGPGAAHLEYLRSQGELPISVPDTERARLRSFLKGRGHREYEITAILGPVTEAESEV